MLHYLSPFSIFPNRKKAFIHYNSKHRCTHSFDESFGEERERGKKNKGGWVIAWYKTKIIQRRRVLGSEGSFRGKHVACHMFGLMTMMICICCFGKGTFTHPVKYKHDTKGFMRCPVPPLCIQLWSFVCTVNWLSSFDNKHGLLWTCMLLPSVSFALLGKLHG